MVFCSVFLLNSKNANESILNNGFYAGNNR